MTQWKTIFLYTPTWFPGFHAVQSVITAQNHAKRGLFVGPLWLRHRQPACPISSSMCLPTASPGRPGVRCHPACPARSSLPPRACEAQCSPQRAAIQRAPKKEKISGDAVFVTSMWDIGLQDPNDYGRGNGTRSVKDPGKLCFSTVCTIF